MSVRSSTARSCAATWRGVRAVLHAATLHKPHVATHSRQDFVDTNITGTLNLLEEAVAAGVRAFVFTSTTSAFGDALIPPAGAPAAWITEDVDAGPEEHLRRDQGGGRGPLPAVQPQPRACRVIVLRTSRFFPEEDDNPASVRAMPTPMSRPTNSWTAASTSRTW